MISTSASSATTLRRHGWLDAFWHLAGSGPVTLALCLLLAAMLALAMIFPQLAIFDGAWLRVVLALLAYNLALRLAQQLRRLWESARPFGSPPPHPPGLPSQRITLAVTLQAGVEAVQESMKAGYRMRVCAADASQARVYGRRGRAGAIGASLMTLGPLLLLVGLVVNNTAGWRTGEIPLAANGSALLPVIGGPLITLNSIEGEGLRTTSSLTVTRFNGRQMQLRAGYLYPARWGNLWITQLATGPALEAHGVSRGRPLSLQSLSAGGQASNEIHLPFRQTQSEQAFAIPDRDLTFRVVSYNALPDQAIQGPVFLVEAYRGDDPTPLMTQFVEKQAILSIDDLTVDLRREQHAVLAASYLPGTVLLVLGVALLAAGALLVLGWGYTETWANMIFEEGATAVTFHTAAPWRGRAEVRRLARAAEALVNAEGRRQNAE